MIFSLSFFEVVGQVGTLDNQDTYFTVRGSVREKYSYKPISEVAIQVNGGSYSTTGYDGNFKIRVKIGDQLMVSHKDFQTRFYTIKGNDRILIEVEPQDPRPSSKELRKRDIQTFNQLIDSADTYLKIDAERSVQFIADALDKSLSQAQNAEAYVTLGNLYMYLRQYDLAIANYKIALQNVDDGKTKLKLAKAYVANNNASLGIKTYNEIDVTTLSNYQQTEFYEGLGDAHLKANNSSVAITTYKKGLKVADNNNIQPKVTDLNSKIAQAYNIKGNPVEAKKFFNNSMRLAKREGEKRAIEEKVTVAEFNNENKNYDDEISLRKQVVEDVKTIETDSIISNESPLTPQKQNYKIGNALILQNKLDEAIPYLDESILEADKRGDLEVKKDAQRRKVDVFESLGEYDKAKTEFEAFMASVDELYLKKQQEISQATRTSRNIRESQNRITSLENDRALSRSRYELTEERNKSQQIIIYSLIGGLALFLIAAYFTYKYIKQQRLANNLLALKSLRSQMNPHFIFNALNSVNSFIASNDERTANKYLSDFSFLMRAVLENSEEDFIPLEKEIELLELYTKLEHFRFKDKFEYVIDIDKSIDVEAYEIPPMLLQPYIENAVWHGLRYKAEKGILKIEIKPKSEDEITIAIIDDGIGRERSKSLKTENQKKHNSKGLSNIKKRIQILNDMYKDKIGVTIDDYQNTEDAGTKVEVTLKKD
ncbi:histidine kinase [Winogradskyella jejuensis]|uniref:Tetratricopeptide repeat-containing protein n=1 Tax=Winogradskyella jejuensis TaxID=1089305 RepID=A0A1M5LRA5_9FLAO|nr:histidine kinase [Winogradskyella jejuensis]SHG67682.1 Tetratricopeptide repeat-containing protein [Winogradskyella jejuensis]